MKIFTHIIKRWLLLLLAVLFIPGWQIANAQDKPGTVIRFSVKDQETGFAIPGAVVQVTTPHGKTATLQKVKGEKLSYPAVHGKYNFTITAPGYEPLQTSFAASEESAINAIINLDPARSIADKIQQNTKIPTPANTIQLTGYVSDADEGTPLSGVQVEVGKYSAITNEKGSFSLQLAAQVVDMAAGKIPETITIRSVKNGYVTHTIQKFYLIPETYTLKISLTATGSPGIQERNKISPVPITEEFESTPHGIFDPKETDAHEPHRIDNSSPTAKDPTDIVALAAVPGSIRVGTGCSCHDCGSVQVMSLEAYTESGLDEEWIASWGAASLQAGAVAYRSYGAWFVQHPIRANYDISSTTCAQVWGSDVVASTRDAARATSGVVLVKSGAIFRSEYSAENNNSGCGNGWSGTGSTWPCISDARCAGRAKNGHGRGMCQWGSSFWASDQNYLWILNHYYNPGGVFVEQPYILVSDGTYRITNVGSGKVLNGRGCSGNNSTIMEQWDWTGEDCQRWLFQHVGDGWYRISSRISGRALDVASCQPGDGVTVQLWDWLNNDCQRWRIQDWGNGQIRLVNKASGKLLDVNNGSTANGVQVWQWSMNGTNAQRWTLTKVSPNYIANGTYRIRLGRNNKVMQPADGNTARGTAMVQWDWLDTSYQKWQIEATPDGWYKFTAAGGAVLDLNICNLDDGGKVMLWDWLDNDCQRWAFEGMGNGLWAIISKASGKVLDGPDPDNGGRVYQWQWLNNGNQLWYVEPVAASPLLTTSKQNNSSHHFSVAPNPVSIGKALRLEYRLDAASQPATILLTDLYGMPLQQQKVTLKKGSNLLSIPTNHLRPGIYTATVLFSNNQKESKKVILIQ